MTLSHISKRIVCAGTALATLILLTAAQSYAADVACYQLTKTHFFKQTSPSVPVSGTLDDNEPWHAGCQVVPSSPGSLYGGSIMIAGHPETEESLEQDYTSGFFEFSRGCLSQAEMDAKAPNGTYTVKMSTRSNGTKIVNLTVGSGAYPSAPWVTNYSATQAINPLSDFNLCWAPITGVTDTDYILVMIVDMYGNNILQSPWPGQTGVLTGTTRSFTIPAGKLQANQYYAAVIFVAKVGSRDTTSYPGAIGYSAHVAVTELQLHAGSAVPVPTIVLQPLDQRCLIGGTANFYVSASGNGPLSYQWKRNGVDLPGQTNATLVVTNVTPLVAGAYCVAVSNPGGTKMSANATLSYIPSGPLPVITSQPTNIHTLKGATVTFSVTAVSTNSPISYQWMQNGLPIPSATNATLKLTNVQYTNSAAYWVNVSNWGGTTQSQPVYLVIVPELVKPTLTITNAPVGGRVFSSTLQVGGKAIDASGVSIVTCGLAGGSETTATGTTNWSAWVTLVPGTNVVRVRAMDMCGNESVITKTFCYVVTAPLTVYTNGLGSVFNPGANLEVGKGYTIKATPAPGNLFLNWSGNGVYTNNPTLSFVMSQGLQLTANFMTNRFPNVQGTYNGMFYQTSPVSSQGAGTFVLSVFPDSSFTFKITMGTAKYSTSGKFSPTGVASIYIPRLGSTPITGELVIDLVNNTDRVQGQLYAQGWMATLDGDRAVYSAKNPAPLAGKYTLSFPPAASYPMGNGYATVTVDPLGKVSFVGYLADGTSVSGGATISKDGDWPLYVPLGNGMLLGWVGFSNSVDNVVTWIKPASTKLYYPQAITNQARLTWSRYRATGAAPALKYADATLTFSGGNLDQPVSSWITLGANNAVDLHGATNITFKLNVLSGSVSGTVWHPVLKKKIPFNGVLLQDVATASGYFMGTNQSGLFTLSPKQP